jgi:16S rRNA (adenine1518-N6/adenine1519-N6)-dimethyltransferase
MSDAAGSPAWEDPRVVLARHGLRAKRSYSQNFLVSQHAVEAIARAAVPEPGVTVVELGPGLGTLTAALLRAGGRVIAIERDRDMLEVLSAELSGFALDLRREDAAAVDLSAIAAQAGEKIAVAGNLPYAITGAILRRLIAQQSAISRAVIMVQREVRDRLVAAPGTAQYGALTVFTRAAFAVETVLKVGAGAFHPRPKVDSAVLLLTPRPTPIAEETEAFRTVVRAAFQSRRKTLRNALTAASSAAVAAKAIGLAGLEPDVRGETLDVAQFAALAAALERAREGA